MCCLGATIKVTPYPYQRIPYLPTNKHATADSKTPASPYTQNSRDQSVPLRSRARVAVGPRSHAAFTPLSPVAYTFAIPLPIS